MSTNNSTALVRRARREQEMQLVRGSFSDPAPGRTLHQVYSHVGNLVGMHANRAAHRWGRGPFATSDRITAFFGAGQQREVKLDALRVDGCPWLEEECSKLLKYALPCETARTQIQAFKYIVTITTRYPGTRPLLLKSKHLRRAGNTEAAISAVWTRADDTQTREWDFYCSLAAVCLSERQISAILCNISPKCLGCIDSESGHFSIIERLLVASECSATSISDALAQRYLAGILELPTFWGERGPIHATVFKKILENLVRVLRDLGLDSGEEEDERDIVFDNEGIDFMASAILVGVLGWRAADFESQSWCRGLIEIVGLLRLSLAESLLPQSSALATGPDIGNIIPDTAPETLEVLIMACSTNTGIEIPPTQADRISPQSIGDAVNDPVADLNFTPKVVYTEATSFQWTTFANDVFRARRGSSGLRNKGDRPPSSGRGRIWILGLLRRFLHPHDVHAAPLETSMDDLSTCDGRLSTVFEYFFTEDQSDFQAHLTPDSDGMSIQMSYASVTGGSEAEQQPFANQILPSASCTDITGDVFPLESVTSTIPLNKIEATEIKPRTDGSLSDSPLSQRAALPEKMAFDAELNEIKTNIDAPLIKPSKTSLGKTVAQITAQFTPVPALAPAAELICGIIDLCQNLTQNRNAAFQLRDRCHRLGLVLYDKAVANEIIGAAIEPVTQCLTLISAKMNVWGQTSKSQGFIRQNEIAKDIERCHKMLTDCLTSFQLTSHVEIHDWQTQFRLDTQEDHRELLEYLVNLENAQSITNDALQSQSNDIRQMMAMMRRVR